MAYAKVKYIFDPIGDVKVVNKAAVLSEIADLVRDEILAHVSDGKSPVAGEGKFKKLNKQYADEEKQGDRVANLDLTGDMLDGLRVVVRKGKIEVYVDGDQGKVEGHNQHDDSLAPKLPKRRFIPDDSQTFGKSILSDIKSIVSENEVEESDAGIDFFTRPAREAQRIAEITRKTLADLNFFGTDDDEG